MPAAILDHDVEQGATFRKTLRWAEPEAPDGTPGTPVDLTDYKARMQVRKGQKTPVLIDLDNELKGGLTLGGVTGLITIFLTDDQTDLLTTKTALYDLEVEAPNEDVYRVVKGKFTVDPNITQEDDDPVVIG